MDYLPLLGLFLMLAPPLIIWRAEWLIEEYEKYLSFFIMIFSAGSLTVFLALLMPEATSTFLFYFALFYFSYRYINLKQNKAEAIILSLYICFSTAVLWEWPIQLTIQLAQENVFWQAQALSLLQASAIPLFIYKVRRLGFKPNFHHYLGLILCVLMGSNLVFMIQDNGMTDLNFWLSHLYRIPWILLMLSMIPKKKLINNSVNNTMNYG